VSYLLIAGITFVYCLEIFLAYTKVLPWMRDGMGYSTPTLAAHAVWMMLMFVNGLSHYVLTLAIPPSPPFQVDNVTPVALATSDDSQPLDRRYYCRHCKIKREATTHHCSVCKTYGPVSLPPCMDAWRGAGLG
jgi:hypothetical protein